MNIFKNKSILVVIILFIVAFVAYTLLRDTSTKSATGVTKQAVSSNTVTTGGGSVAQAALDGPGKEFVAQLLAIQNINFTLDFFRDPVFIGLQDWSRNIQPQEVGRPNPFAPIGDESRVGSPITPEQAVENLTGQASQSTETPVKTTTVKPAVKPVKPSVRR